MNQFLKISNSPTPHTRTLIGSVSLEKALINTLAELQITSLLLNDRLNVQIRNIM